MRISKYKVELVKESASNYNVSNKSLTSPSEVVKLLNEIFNLENQTDEHFVMLALNTKNKVIGAFEVCVGTINSSLVNVRGIMQRALLCNASRIMVAHNHPSGSSEPSQADRDVTRKLKHICELMDIPLLDHIVIGEEEYYSFKAEGLL